METPGKGGLEHRARLEFCIDVFVEETGYVPAGARPVMSPGELSPALERVAHSLSTTVWRAWGEGVRQWFVLGHSDEWPDHNPCPVLHLVFLDQDARPVASGIWHRIGPAQWEFDGPLKAASMDDKSSRLADRRVT